MFRAIIPHLAGAVSPPADQPDKGVKTKRLRKLPGRRGPLAEWRRTMARKKNVYSVHPGVAMVQKWIAELPEKTGRTLEQWLELIRKEGPADPRERRAWLKQKHGLGTNTAWWLVERA